MVGTPEPLDASDRDALTFGQILPALRANASRISGVLARSDQRRAWTSFHLMTSPGALDALEELTTFADGLAEWASRTGSSPVSEFGLRIRNDIEDSVDGMLTLRATSILNACRDLMEVTVLIRDLRKNPTRLSKWLTSTEDVRRREFGFGHELFVDAADSTGIPYLGSDRAEILTEYTLHSRTLHPAPATSDPSELSHEVPEEVAGAPWVVSYTYEICRHGMAALWQLLNWLIDLGPDAVDEEGEDFLPKNDGPLETFAQNQSRAVSHIDPEAREQAMSRYRNVREPRRKDH